MSIVQETHGLVKHMLGVGLVVVTISSAVPHDINAGDI